MLKAHVLCDRNKNAPNRTEGTFAPVAPELESGDRGLEDAPMKQQTDRGLQAFQKGLLFERAINNDYQFSFASNLKSNKSNPI